MALLNEEDTIEKAGTRCRGLILGKGRSHW